MLTWVSQYFFLLDSGLLQGVVSLWMFKNMLFFKIESFFQNLILSFEGTGFQENSTLVI